MSARIRQLHTAYLIFLLFAIFLTSCGEDNIISPGVHFQPRGLYIQPEGLPDTLVYYHNGNFLLGKDSLFVAVNDTSAHLDIRFLDVNRNEVQPPMSGYSLGLEVGNTSVASAYSDELWAFHIAGLSVGETTLTIKVLHQGHSDFTTLPIRIRVIP
ncbi:MAG: hypothetical protein N2510_05735 [Ignavibacteria bacterium]|nr:hypothetical protein [Ignavibacteria bacterium]